MLTSVCNKMQSILMKLKATDTLSFNMWKAYGENF